jgi:hypothetical protein
MAKTEVKPSESTQTEPETIGPDMMMLMMVMGGFAGPVGTAKGIVAQPKFIEPESLGGGSRIPKKGW